MSELPTQSSPSGPGNPKDGDQYREYYIPVKNIEEEQELLDEYETDKFAHALREIYTDFYLLIELMRGYAENNDDDDDYYDEGDDEVSGVKTPRFRGSKVLYMTFTKRATKNLHYMV